MFMMTIINFLHICTTLSNLVAALKEKFKRTLFSIQIELYIIQLQLKTVGNAKCSSMLLLLHHTEFRATSTRVYPQRSINMFTSSFPSSISIPSPHIAIAIVIAARPLCMWIPGAQTGLFLYIPHPIRLSGQGNLRRQGGYMTFF